MSVLINFQNWITWLYRAEQNHEKRISAIETGTKVMADAFDTLKTDYEGFKADVTAYVTSSQQKIAELQAAVAAGDATKVAALATEIETDHAAFLAAVNPPAPAATPAPAPAAAHTTTTP